MQPRSLSTLCLAALVRLLPYDVGQESVTDVPECLVEQLYTDHISSVSEFATIFRRFPTYRNRKVIQDCRDRVIVKQWGERSPVHLNLVLSGVETKDVTCIDYNAAFGKIVVGTHTGAIVCFSATPTKSGILTSDYRLHISDCSDMESGSGSSGSSLLDTVTSGRVKVQRKRSRALNGCFHPKDVWMHDDSLDDNPRSASNRRLVGQKRKRVHHHKEQCAENGGCVSGSEHWCYYDSYDHTALRKRTKRFTADRDDGDGDGDGESSGADSAFEMGAYSMERHLQKQWRERGPVKRQRLPSMSQCIALAEQERRRRAEEASENRKRQRRRKQYMRHQIPGMDAIRFSRIVQEDTVVAVCVKGFVHRWMWGEDARCSYVRKGPYTMLTESASTIRAMDEKKVLAVSHYDRSLVIHHYGFDSHSTTYHVSYNSLFSQSVSQLEQMQRMALKPEDAFLVAENGVGIYVKPLGVSVIGPNKQKTMYTENSVSAHEFGGFMAFLTLEGNLYIKDAETGSMIAQTRVKWWREETLGASEIPVATVRLISRNRAIVWDDVSVYMYAWCPETVLKTGMPDLMRHIHTIPTPQPPMYRARIKDVFASEFVIGIVNEVQRSVGLRDEELDPKFQMHAYYLDCDDYGNMVRVNGLT